MTQPNQRSNLLGRATPTENPRYKAEADALEAHDRAVADKANPETNVEKPVEPNHNWEKRYKDLQSHSSRKQNTLQAEIDALKTQGVQPLVVPKTPEEMAKLKATDPEGYARIEAIATNLVQTQMNQYDQKLAAVTGDLLETKIEKAELAIKSAHPDFEQIVSSDQFHAWAEKQNSEIQDWIYNNPDEPQKAIQAISLYKFASGMGTQTNSQSTQLPHGGDQAVNVRTPSQSPEAVDRNHPAYIWKESEIAGMRPDEFQKWDELITLAQREGRVAIGQ